MSAVFSRYWPIFLQGAWGTLWISLVVVFFGTLLGALLALGKNSKFKPLSKSIALLVEIIRGTPLLLQMYFFVYAVSDYFVRMDDLTWVLIALIINSSGYVCEVFRAGINAVDKGQFEAAQSLGLSKRHTMQKIIFPQAIKNILPALGNEFITMIKETSIASVLFIPNLMTSERLVTAASHRKMESLLIAGILYFILTYTLSRILARFEKKVKRA